MPIISEEELKLSMSNSNGYKSHSGVSDRHNKSVQEALHSVIGQILRNFATNTERSDELLAHPEKVPQRGVNSEILQWIESTIVQTSNQKDKGIEKQKVEDKQGRSHISFYQPATRQPTSPRREDEQ
ncbi:hypothetical protein O181_095095 [Austropuccinia psidii MF-1]|uniref:Uncharacterized protein n=1 Tax=Austropuccinia psidii MF-1 TaxID=1389203 RepID=A0A9Q3PBP9_9BASI|nr:hypothetical protein [Austropuccinia psidii MF-1]